MPSRLLGKIDSLPSACCYWYSCDSSARMARYLNVSPSQPLVPLSHLPRSLHPQEAKDGEPESMHPPSATRTDVSCRPRRKNDNYLTITYHGHSVLLQDRRLEA